MRCVDVIRELAAPTGGPVPPGLDEHLAGCPRCATWARRDARLEQLWEATRPPVPPPVVWDALWANVSAAREPSPAPAPAPSARPALPRRWRRAALTMAALVQAAALLIAVLALSRPSPRPPQPAPAVVTAPPPPPTLKIVIDPGAPVIFGPDGQVRTLAQNENSDTVDRYLTMFNAVEAMAPLQ